MVPHVIDAAPCDTQSSTRSRGALTFSMADDAPLAPLLLFVVGPPAVGKMTVGAAIAQRTGLRLFHNHQTIDLVLRFFPFGTPPFQRLVVDLRRRILEEVAASDLPGIIFTFVRAFDQTS